MWEFISLILYGEGISYNVLSFFYDAVFYLWIGLYFLIFTYFLVKSQKICQKQFLVLLQNLPFLFLLIFFSIFFLYYHKVNLPSQSDQYYYYYLMNIFNHSGKYSIPNVSSSVALLYSNVGFYQFGSTLILKTRLFLMPYLTTFFYFYITTTSLFYVLNHYIKSKWFMNFVLYILTFLFLVFYIFINTNSGYVMMVGNIESAYLLSLLLIPSFINLNKFSSYEILIIFIGYVFYNETAILVAPLYLACYIIVSWWRRKKSGFTILNFISSIFVFIILCYLLISDFLFVKTNLEYDYIFTFYKWTPLVFGFCVTAWLICILLLFLKNLGLMSIDKYHFFKLIKNYWISGINLKKYRSLINNWFQRRSNLLYKFMRIFIIVLIFVTFYFATYSINIENNYSFIDNMQNKYYVLIWLYFSIIFTKIIWFKKTNSFMYFFLLLTILSTIAGFLFWGSIAGRYLYSSVYMTYGMAGLIHDFVLGIFFLFISRRNLIRNKIFSDFEKTYKKWMKKIPNKLKLVSYFIYKKRMPILSASIETITILPIFVSSAFGMNKSAMKFSSINNNIYGDLNVSTITELQRYNFGHYLTFSDIPLPIFNLSSDFNISHALYGLYYSPSYVWNRMKEFTPFKSIDGKVINILDQSAYKNEIFPYYNYIVIKRSDTYFLSIVSSMNEYKLIDNINNQILIFKNTDLNNNYQNKFKKYNDGGF